MSVAALALLQNCLERQLAPPVLNWLADRFEATRTGDRAEFHLAFGLIPRKTGKTILQLTEAELLQAKAIQPGWRPELWSVDQAARTLLVNFLPSEPEEAFREILDRTFAAGEVGELVALYQSLWLLPHPESHRLRAAEGIRSSIRTVFGAVSQDNSYPASHLEEGPFNQMVLKCLFVGLPLDPIVGLDSRTNPRLARMLLDYARERWAAKRDVSPELWRPLSPFVDFEICEAMRRLLEQGSEMEKQAAVLTLKGSFTRPAQLFLGEHSERLAPLLARPMNWSEIAQQWLTLQRG
jgi:hypothetical protein